MGKSRYELTLAALHQLNVDHDAGLIADRSNRRQLCAAAEISESWATEIHKGMRLAEYVIVR